MRYQLGIPPTARQTGTPQVVYQPTDTDLAQRGDATLYFGPSDAGGQAVDLRSRGLLEVEVPGLVRPIQVPFEIPVPRRESVADEDALNELTSWFNRLNDDDEKTSLRSRLSTRGFSSWTGRPRGCWSALSQRIMTLPVKGAMRSCSSSGPTNRHCPPLVIDVTETSS
jgi:hypothetical protein